MANLEVSGVDPAFWRGRRVLLTGHTGFKGAWASLWLARMGARVTGFALSPATEPALFSLAKVTNGIDSRLGDLRDEAAMAAAISECDPEIVLHLAAQALVRRSYVEPVTTFDVNVTGTARLLQALRSCRSLKAVLVVTTDKVYANHGDGRAFRENDALGGHDPYAASKAGAELVSAAMAHAYFEPAGVAIATARGGNVIGGGDFSEDRLIPDLIRAMMNGEAVKLRRPDATRPWQHVLDCLSGYLTFAQALTTGQTQLRALNFGPTGDDEVPVHVVAEMLQDALGLPTKWLRDPVSGPNEAARLVLDSSAARAELGWFDRLPRHTAVAHTAAWYQAWRSGQDMRAVTLAQIDDYTGRVA